MTLVTYLGDWLLIHTDKTVLMHQTAVLVDKAIRLGWIISVDKSQLNSNRSIDYLGMSMDLSTFLVRPVPTWVEGLLNTIQQLSVWFICVRSSDVRFNGF